ncbi:hypothetical protein GCM10025876_28480 [Demequina litorisediminis]|uniref:ABC transporter domain-containing protein n=1 Tax=Demequina litorisediminis TaxID=1849022 RepID=A0ABQ6IIX1_9MICO|nr:hypothetical protein GCM10025876_28480 [Demequina litorisediminis]
MLRRREANRRTREIMTRLGHAHLSPTREVGTLSPANQQIVSMARALSHDIRLMIMDEPSAVLDSEEVDNLFRVVEEPHPPGHRRHLHFAPPRGDRAHRRPHHRAQGRPL